MRPGREKYSGPVQAVILDWAGTTVDHGCRGPAAVFSRAFESFGIEPSIEEVRGPMGREKKEHCRTMLAMPRLRELWLRKHGRYPDEGDVEAVFARVGELMAPTLADYAEPVPGCLEAIAELRKRGVKIGSCTGYSRYMMEKLLPRARSAGYSPDCLVTADEVPEGRPLPWMCWLNCMRLSVFPPESVVKAGDTIADIKEGLNAGHWSVGLTRSSNALGLSEKEAREMDQMELARREAEARGAFLKAGAHYVISTISELPELCDKISAQMRDF